MVSPGAMFLSTKWRDEASRKLELLVHMDHARYMEFVSRPARAAVLGMEALGFRFRVGVVGFVWSSFRV